MASSIMPFPEDYFLILQSCLDCLLDESQTIEALLLLYPRLCEQLRPPLEAAAWLYSKKGLLNPRPEFIQASKNHIVTNLYLGLENTAQIKKIRGRKTKLVIWKNAVFFSLVGPMLTSMLK